MRKVIPNGPLDQAFISTQMDPVAAHVAYIRHLSRTSGLIPILVNAHGIASADAPARAEKIVPYIQQGLHFHGAALQATPRVRPVLRYYAYTNLAKAVVLLYQPKGFSDVRWHGASDTTDNLSGLQLTSEVMTVKKGVIPLFNSLIGWRDLSPGQPVSLKELLVAIPPVGAELMQFYRTPVEWIEVSPHKSMISSSIASQFGFHLWAADLRSPGKGNLADAISVLHGDPNYDLDPGGQAVTSKARWAATDDEIAEAAHQEAAQRYVNLGGHFFTGERALKYLWRWAPAVPILPTLSAALMLSFVMSSLYRYRAGLLDSIESSELSLILEVFEAESDALVLPGIRHLLYGRPIFISRGGPV